MSDAADVKTMSELAVKREIAPRRSQETRSEKDERKTTGAFGGFLQSFLRRRTRADKTLTGGQPDEGGKAALSKAAAKARGEKREALRRALAKTRREDERRAAEAEERQKNAADAADAARTAEEAARAIWNALLPQGDDAPGQPGDALDDRIAGAASLLAAAGTKEGGSGRFGAFGAVGGEGAAASAGLESANVSAEMNIAAVLSTLEELPDSLAPLSPESAPEKAAEKTGAPAPMPGGASTATAEALGLEVETGNAAADLLASLDNKEHVAGLFAAEAEETSKSLASAYDRFEDFLEEIFAQNDDSPAVKMKLAAILRDPEVAFEAFSKWCESVNIPFYEKGLPVDETHPGSRLGARLGMRADALPGAPGSFSTTVFEDLESPLLHGNGVRGGEDLATGAGGETGWGDGALPASNQAETATPAKSGAAPDQTGSMLDQIRNIERIAEVLRLANRRGVQNLTLRLSPPELGRVTVRVESRNGMVSALFRVEQGEAAAQLRDGLAQLRESLRAQGIETGDLEVARQETSMADGDGRHGAHARGDGRGAADGKPPAGGDAEEAPGDGREWSRAAGSLNIFA